jgi:hypothetical protein
MKDIIVKIMVEVLGIFAIMTKEIKQGRASESIADAMFPITDRDSEKYLKKLIGRRDIEDALSRLDRLTQEEARMATAQVLKVAHRVENEVGTVGNQVRGIDDKVNVAVEGTHVQCFSANAILTLSTTRWQGNKGSGATGGEQHG